MATDQNIEKIYQLVEQFEFTELPAEDKLFVITYFSESDYQRMRETIKETKNYFENTPELTLDDSIYKSLSVLVRNKNVILKFAKYPLELYKVAASVLIILGITLMAFYKSYQSYSSNVVVKDTIYIKKTDTVFSIIRDTIQIVKNLVVYIPQKSDTNIRNTYLANNIGTSNCRNEICPSDIEKITGLAGTNNISRDSFLTDFMVSLK